MTTTKLRPGNFPGRSFFLRHVTWKKVLAVSLILVTVLTIAGTLFVSSLWSRPKRLDLDLSHRPDKIWLFVGLDDRSELPPGPDYYGRADSVGARADVILFVRETSHGVEAISVPRGLSFIKNNKLIRFGNSWSEGPNAMIALACSELDVPITNVVAITMRGLVNLVDGLGGVEVTLPYGIRDEYAHIEMSAGTRKVDGITALALVRSRQGEIQVQGQWQQDPEGALGRQRRAGEVFSAVISAAKKSDPISLSRTAWSVSESISLSSNTQFTDVLGLLGKGVSVTNLPTFVGDSTDFFVPDQETSDTLKKYEMTGCS